MPMVVSSICNGLSAIEVYSGSSRRDNFHHAESVYLPLAALSGANARAAAARARTRKPKNPQQSKVNKSNAGGVTTKKKSHQTKAAVGQIGSVIPPKTPSTPSKAGSAEMKKNPKARAAIGVRTKKNPAAVIGIAKTSPKAKVTPMGAVGGTPTKNRKANPKTKAAVGRI